MKEKQLDLFIKEEGHTLIKIWAFTFISVIVSLGVLYLEGWN